MANTPDIYPPAIDPDAPTIDITAELDDVNRDLGVVESPIGKVWVLDGDFTPVMGFATRGKAIDYARAEGWRHIGVGVATSTGWEVGDVEELVEPVPQPHEDDRPKAEHVRRVPRDGDAPPPKRRRFVAFARTR